MKCPNIFLIGFMGSGKTYWGKIWAEKLQYEFVDLDQQIEHYSQMKIAAIFENLGEEKFRELEKFQLRNFRPNSKKMISCGGGTPCFHGNMEWMLKNGLVIYLKATPGYIADRLKGETDQRPLLKKRNGEELMEFIISTLDEREPVYNMAHFIFDVNNLNDDSIQMVINGKDCTTEAK